MKKFQLLILSGLLAAGCDSGGDSSSGSSANVTDVNTVGSDQIGAQYAGTYSGSLDATYTASDLGLSDSVSYPVTIVIDKNGRVTVRADGRSYSGNLDADSVTAVVKVNESYDDIRCTGNINVNAQVSGNRINGRASGTGNCSQGSISTPVRVAGQLNAST